MVVKAAAPSEVAEYEAGPLERPKWAGETPLSRLVGAVISFKPIYSLLKLGARQVLIRSSLNFHPSLPSVLEVRIFSSFSRNCLLFIFAFSIF